MLITEGLAELKTLSKRIEKKQDYIKSFLFRADGLRDPLEKEGGSVKVITGELQAVSDLKTRLVAIRTAIQRTNLTTPLTVEGRTMSIAEWLTWRKEVSENEQGFIRAMRLALQQARTSALARGATVVPPGSAATAPSDLLVNVSESALAAQAEHLETVLGILDGQLSLKNATIQIDGL